MDDCRYCWESIAEKKLITIPFHWKYNSHYSAYLIVKQNEEIIITNDIFDLEVLENTHYPILQDDNPICHIGSYFYGDRWE